MCAQSKYKGVKFSCKQRGPLLSALYQCMALAAADNLCPVAPKLLGWGLLSAWASHCHTLVWQRIKHGCLGVAVWQVCDQLLLAREPQQPLLSRKGSRNF
jgi:hypothetical protein